MMREIGRDGQQPAEDELTPPPVDTANDYLLSAGSNLPNHSESLKGRGKFVRQSLSVVPTFRTRQEAYRFAAYLVELAEAVLPDEEGCEAHDFETVRSAICNA